MYALLGTREAEMPPRVQQMFHHMAQHNWLLGYAEIEGIRRALTGLSRRASAGSGMETAAEELQANYAAYEADFRAYFPELQQQVAELLVLHT
jgi:acyl carrier protein phosphodiesterase